jgi:hypothetical protein
MDGRESRADQARSITAGDQHPIQPELPTVLMYSTYHGLPEPHQPVLNALCRGAAGATLLSIKTVESYPGSILPQGTKHHLLARQDVTSQMRTGPGNIINGNGATGVHYRKPPGTCCQPTTAHGMPAVGPHLVNIGIGIRQPSTTTLSPMENDRRITGGLKPGLQVSTPVLRYHGRYGNALYSSNPERPIMKVLATVMCGKTLFQNISVSQQLPLYTGIPGIYQELHD